MKLWKKVLVLVLILLGVAGVIWGIWEFGGIGRTKEQREPIGQGGQEKLALEKDPLKFAVMSDIHSDWEGLRKALEKVREIGGFVIITGDLTTVGKKSELTEAKQILDESGIRYYVIPGNHDHWTSHQLKTDLFTQVFGLRFLSFKEEEIKFILVDNGDYRGLGGDNPAQTEWLKNELKECPRIYCLVFMHMPLNHPKSLHVMGEDSNKVASEAAQLAQMLVRQRVKKVFTGHLHYSSDYEISGLNTRVTGALTSERNWQSAKFLEVTYENSQLQIQDQFVPN